MRLAVCEDEDFSRNDILSKCKVWSEESAGQNVQISMFSDAEELLRELEQGTEFQGFFLDIQLPGMNGYELAKTIRKRGIQATIVFITNYDTFLREGYEVSAYRYLRKPISQEALSTCLNHILDASSQGEEVVTSIRTQTGEINVPIRQVVCVRYGSHKIEVFLKDKTYVQSIQGSFSQYLESKLNGKLLQCNQGEAVNLHFVSAYTKNSLTMENGVVLTISRSRRQQVLEVLNQYFLTH